jgi:hypothetical protein
MAGFDASSIVEPLKWSFAKLAELPPVGCGIKELANVEGVIREPTSLQVEKFMDTSRRDILRQRRELADQGLADTDSMTQDEILEAFAKIDPAAAAKRSAAARKRSAEILSALCSGEPTSAQLLLLPHRILIAFAEWITGEVLSPEVAAGGGNGQVLNLPSRAAG